MDWHLKLSVSVKWNTLVFFTQISKESSVSGKKNPEKEVTRMVLTMVGAFSLGWFPYAVVAMYNALNIENQVRVNPVIFTLFICC